MSIRLDPRRLGALKLLAAEAGLRPGELVTQWVEERLDAARSGSPAVTPAGSALPAALLAEVNARIDALARRIDELSYPKVAQDATDGTAAAQAVEPIKRRRGRPPKARAANAPAAKTPGARARRSAERIALHDEIAAVIAERGPQTASELAVAITERGRYHAPRSAKPLDAAIVNARVSNPKYRPRFVRRSRRIGLAEGAVESPAQ